MKHGKNFFFDLFYPEKLFYFAIMNQKENTMRKLILFLVVSLFFCLRVSSDNSRFYDSGQLSCNLITKIS